MKIRLHHIEMCVKDPQPVLYTLCTQFGLEFVGQRETAMCAQSVVKMAKTVFIITKRKKKEIVVTEMLSADTVVNGVDDDDDDPETRPNPNPNPNKKAEESLSVKFKSLSGTSSVREPWTVFCCDDNDGNKDNEDHIDSVFNVAMEVEDLPKCIDRLMKMGCMILQDLTETTDQYGTVNYAIVKSCCGNVIHTLIEKINYDGWFLPGFQRVPNNPYTITGPFKEKFNSPRPLCAEGDVNSHFDHVALVCRVGETDSIIRWYQEAFEMKRFITNRQDSDEEGLVISEDIGIRLKVMAFWKCSETGIASSNCSDSAPDSWEVLKIVIAESLPTLQNTQIEGFIESHKGPGLQHIGIHTSDMLATVEELVKRGVNFRKPPPTYYTMDGQLKEIESVGVDPVSLSKYGILLDNEADPFDDETDNDNIDDPLISTQPQRYLMQIFTHPIFDADTFFLEVIQRKGARGFGIGNVTALAKSVNAYKLQLQNHQNPIKENNYT